MAILQSLIALLTRSVGRILSALFGWAVVALFGETSPGEKTWLSVLVAAAAAWPLLVLGVVWPRAATFVLAFVPVPAWLSSAVIRWIWVGLAVAVPFALGIALASRSHRRHPAIPGTAAAGVDAVPHPGAPPAPSGSGESAVIRLLRGFPITLAVAAAFGVVFVTVPIRRLAAIARRRVELNVPLITDAQGYGLVAQTVAVALAASGMPVEPVEPPWWLKAPGRILIALGGKSFRDYVPEELACFRGSSLDVILYPSSLSLTGPAREAAWAHGFLVEALAPAPAYQTVAPEAQDIERQIRSVWSVYRQCPPAHVDAVPLRSRLREIARDIRTLSVDFEQWQVIYRQALQLDRALAGRPQLLENETDGAPAAARAPSVDRFTASAAGDVRALSTRELGERIAAKTALLVRKELELVKAEARADVRTELRVATGLGVGALAALLGLNALTLAIVAALAGPMSPWLAALLVAAPLLAAAGGLAARRWSRRLAHPLARTRRAVRDTARWARDMGAAR